MKRGHLFCVNKIIEWWGFLEGRWYELVLHAREFRERWNGTFWNDPYPNERYISDSDEGEPTPWWLELATETRPEPATPYDFASDSLELPFPWL